jgi:hypothetical protein
MAALLLRVNILSQAHAPIASWYHRKQDIQTFVFGNRNILPCMVQVSDIRAAPHLKQTGRLRSSSAPLSRAAIFDVSFDIPVRLQKAAAPICLNGTTAHHTLRGVE